MVIITSLPKIHTTSRLVIFLFSRQNFSEMELSINGYIGDLLFEEQKFFGNGTAK
jgi:hypothetical protein